MSIELTAPTDPLSVLLQSLKQLRSSLQSFPSLNKLQADGEAERLKSQMRQAENLLKTVESRYLDPQNARKVGMMRIQLKAMQDRLRQLQSKNKQQSNNSHKINDQYDGRNQRNRQSAHQSDSFAHNEDTSLFDYDLQRRLMIQKSKHLNQVQRKISEVHSITIQTQEEILKQGQDLHSIDLHLDTTKQQLGKANTNLKEANELQKKGRKKYIWLIAIIVALVAITVILLYVVN